MVNGVPNEGHSDLTSMMNRRSSPLEKQKDTTTPVSTEESNPGKLHVIRSKTPHTSVFEV